MPKFIISWEIGYGPNYEVVEAETQEEAQSIAYEHAREDFENQADWSAVPYSDELAEDYGV